MTMTYRAVRCPCGHPFCEHWHVSGVARVEGVSFTEAQANAVADLLNRMEAGTIADPTTESGPVQHTGLDTGEIEDQIISELLDRALGRGWGVSVHDGEEYPLRRCYDKATIIAAMRSTDHDSLHFRGVDGEYLGVVVLIYGNGEDLISDHTDNGPMAALAEQVNAVFTPPHDGDDYADRAAWQSHRAMTGGR